MGADGEEGFEAGYAMRFGRGNKYNAKRTARLGLVHDSGDESLRYQELYLLEKAGEIYGLERQVWFDLVVNGHSIARIKVDFVYRKSGMKYAEEFKGKRTRDYDITRKLFRALYPDFIFIETTEDALRK